MERNAHFADTQTFQMALATGVVEAPSPRWDPALGAWVIQARPRQGGQGWVLGRGQRPTGFAQEGDAREAARQLRQEAIPYLVGRR